MRQLLFDLPLPFLVRLSIFDRLQPLINNIYSVHKITPVTLKSGDYKRLAMICYFKRAYYVTLSSSQGSRSKSTKRASSSYNVEFKIIKYVSHVEFQPTGSSLNYYHSLDESDTSKRNSLLRGLVQLDIALKAIALLDEIRAMSRLPNQDKSLLLMTISVLTNSYAPIGSLEARDYYIRISERN